MHVTETTNKEDIRKVLCHPDIYNVINGDGSPDIDDFEVPIDNSIEYIAGYAEDDIIGLMIYHTVNDCVKCHIQVLPEYRQEYAKEFARIALKFGRAKNVIINAEIPECYPNVISFAKEFGFEESGIIKNGRTKNGADYDVIKMRLI